MKTPQSRGPCPKTCVTSGPGAGSGRPARPRVPRERWWPSTGQLLVPRRLVAQSRDMPRFYFSCSSSPAFILIAAWAVDDEDDRALCVEVAWSPSAALGVRSGAPKHVWTLDHVQVLFPSLRWQGRKSSRSQRAVREGIRITSGPNKSLNRFVGLSQNSFGVGGGCVLSNSGV